MPVKKLGIVVLLIVLSCQVKAQQRSADIGLFVGGGTPLTDFTRTKITESLNFDFGIFYRHNYNSRILAELRDRLPRAVELWAGGSNPALRKRLPEGVRVTAALTDLAHSVHDWRERHRVSGF